MSIATEITRIATLRDNIRTKLISLGIISDEAAKLSACASAIDGMKEATLSTPTIAVTPDIAIDSATGIVTATGSGSGIVSATEGYSKGLSGTISASTEGSLQLETLGAQTITPGTANKTIAAGRWLTGVQTIKGDSNLIAANIKSGTSILGVSGSASSSVSVISGKASTIAYTNGTFRTSLDGSSTATSNYFTVSVPDASKVLDLYARYTIYRFTFSDGVVSYNNVRYLKLHKWWSNKSVEDFYIPLNTNSLMIPAHTRSTAETSKTFTYYIFVSG